LLATNEQISDQGASKATTPKFNFPILTHRAKRSGVEEVESVEPQNSQLE